MSKKKIIEQVEEIKNYLESVKDQWFINGKVDELEFATLYLSMRPMMFYKHLYDINDVVDEMYLRKELTYILKEYLKSSGLITSVNNIISFLKSETYVNEYKPSKNTIHTLNAKLIINDELEIEVLPKEVTINRLNVNYDSTIETPKKWLAFLDNLLIPMDIEILQEFSGYCLIATIEKQKALLIIGKEGGEGKSTVLNLLQCLYGKSSMVQKTIDKMFNNRFGFARVNNKLIIYDDDMKPLQNKMIEPLKKFISLDELEYEAKYEMEESLNHYARFIGLGNNVLDKIKTDDTAFNRRLLVLNVKPKDPNRQDNTKLLEELKLEIDAIFNWALDGLIRLIKNNFEFSYSEEMKDRVSDMLKDDTDLYIHEFLKDSNYVIFDSESESTSSDLYIAYKRRCILNNFEEVTSARFFTDLNRVYEIYNLKYLNKAGEYGRRGYRGIKSKPQNILDQQKEEVVTISDDNYDEMPF